MRLKLTDRFVKSATTGDRKSLIFMDDEVMRFWRPSPRHWPQKLNARLHVRRTAPAAVRRSAARREGLARVRVMKVVNAELRQQQKHALTRVCSSPDFGRRQQQTRWRKP